MSNATLYYVHDPMCSWCWGYRPTWTTLQQQLKHQLGESLDIAYLVGGLAADSQDPMPETMQQFLQQTWQKISQQLGTEFNHDFWTHCQPRRSTYPACRATIIARQFSLEQEMIHAIQQAYYLNAMNPSDNDTLTQLVAQLGMPAAECARLLIDEDIDQILMHEIEFARQLPIQGFPSLVLLCNQVAYPIALDYQDWRTSFNQIKQCLS